MYSCPIYPGNSDFYSVFPGSNATAEVTHRSQKQSWSEQRQQFPFRAFVEQLGSDNLEKPANSRGSCQSHNNSKGEWNRPGINLSAKSESAAPVFPAAQQDRIQRQEIYVIHFENYAFCPESPGIEATANRSGGKTLAQCLPARLRARA